MSDLKFSALWALSGIVIGFIAIAIGYWILHSPVPGYQIVVAPGIAAANLFTEEINLWPKIAIMLAGQYLGYFTIIFAIKKISNLR